MTKKIASILFTINCFYFANGQIKKDAILLGGQIAYYNSSINYLGSQKNSNTKQGIYNVSFGKCFKENTVYGFNISYSPNSISNYYNGVDYVNLKVNQFMLGIFFRNYKPLAKDFYFFTEAGLSYLNNKQEITDTLGVSSGTIKQNGGLLHLTPGISYRIFNKLNLEIIIPNIVSVQYVSTTTNTKSENSSQDQFLFNSSLNSYGLNYLGVGFHFIF